MSDSAGAGGSGIDGKAIAIISYLTLIGWVIALILHGNNKSDIGAFHLRQALGLGVLSMIFAFIPILGWILNIGVLVLWILGLISAVQGEKKAVPLVGAFFQKNLTMIS
jgi:uncharacterized membrane protein